MDGMDGMDGFVKKKIYVPEEELEFSEEYAKEMMVEAQNRIKEAAKEIPGVWSWAKVHRIKEIETANQRKAQYEQAFLDKDIASCCQWSYYYEIKVKKIMKDFSMIQHSKLK